MSVGSDKVRQGGLVVLRGRAGAVAVRRRAASRSSVDFREIELTLSHVRILSVQAGDGPPLAKDGDDLAVAGQVREGYVEPVAWWNFSENRGYSPRVREFWPCVVAAVALLGWLAIRIVQGNLQSADLPRTALPLLLLVLLVASAHSRRRAVRAIEALRAGVPVAR